MWMKKMLMACGANPTGEQIFTSSGDFVVPPGVQKVCVVCVGSGTGDSTDSSFGVDVPVIGQGSSGQTGGGYSGADGGGYGGDGAPTYDPGDWRFGPGGGAGGYSGDGGNGVNVNSSAGDTTGEDGLGGAGAGGGSDGCYYGAGGGGVGLFGEGDSGLGVSGDPGQGGSGGEAGEEKYNQGANGGIYGGGKSGFSGINGKGGGGLAWKNDIPVIPGQVIPVSTGGNGAVRVIWGNGRAFPSTNVGAPVDVDLSDGLVAHYLLHDNALDELGNYDGNDFGTASFTGSSALFEGSSGNGYIKAYPFPTFDSDYSVAFKVKLDSYNISYVDCLLGKNTSSSGWSIETVGIAGNPPYGRIDFLHREGGHLYTSSSLELGTWYRIVCTYSPSTQTARIYVDKALWAEKTDMGELASGYTARPLYMGVDARDNNGYTPNGEMEDVRLYNKVLNQAEIDALDE